MIKDLIKLANNLDSKGLRREADLLDSLIQKLAAKGDFYDKLGLHEDEFPYKDDFDSKNPEKIKFVLKDHGILKEDILEPDENEEEWPVKFKKYWTDRDGNEFFDIIELETVGDAYLALEY